MSPPWGSVSGASSTDPSTALANAVRLFLASPTTGRREALEKALNDFEAQS